MISLENQLANDPLVRQDRAIHNHLHVNLDSRSLLLDIVGVGFPTLLCFDEQ